MPSGVGFGVGLGVGDGVGSGVGVGRRLGEGTAADVADGDEVAAVALDPHATKKVDSMRAPTKEIVERLLSGIQLKDAPLTPRIRPIPALLDRAPRRRPRRPGTARTRARVLRRSAVVRSLRATLRRRLRGTRAGTAARG